MSYSRCGETPGLIGATATDAGTGGCAVGRPVSGSTASWVSGDGIGGIASRNASTSCANDDTRTFVLVDFLEHDPYATRQVANTGSFWSAKARRVSWACASSWVKTVLRVSSSVPSISVSRRLCSCSIDRISAIIC